MRAPRDELMESQVYLELNFVLNESVTGHVSQQQKVSKNP